MAPDTNTIPLALYAARPAPRVADGQHAAPHADAPDAADGRGPLIALSLDDLFDHLDTEQLRYSDRCKALSGQWVQLSAHIARTHDDSRWLIVDVAGACPDCSPVPVATVELLDFEMPSGVDLSLPLSFHGRLSWGHVIGDDGHASQLRLEQARVHVPAQSQGPSGAA